MKNVFLFLLIALSSMCYSQITWMGNEYTTLGTQYLGDDILFEIQSYPIAANQGAQVYIDWGNDGYGSIENVDWYSLNFIENVGNNSKWNNYVRMREVGTHNRKYLGWQSGQSDYVTGDFGTFVVSSLQDPTIGSTSYPSNSKVTLNWTNWNSKWVLIVRNTSDSWTTPTNGTVYNAGDLIGQGTVVYLGGDETFTDELLESSTTYYYKMYSENHSYFSSGSVETTTTTAVLSSSSSGDWSSTSTWNGGVVPTIDDNVSITNTISVDANASCANLTISSSGAVTINASQTLTVNGNMTMNSGASLLETGTLTAGSVLIQRAISGYTTSTDGWHMMSSPIVAMTIGESDFSPASNEDLYFWSEEYNLWINYKDGATPSFTTVNGGDVMNPGTGYLVAYNSTSTKEFDDLSPDDNSPNNSDIIKSSLPYHTGNTYTGYNLLGNPFPCALQWGTAEWLLTNVNTTAKVWNEGGASFTDVAANGYIPAMNGFMVYVSSTSNSLKIPKAARAHNSTPWYKSAETTTNEIKLTATDTEGSTFQETVIKFNAGATEGFDMDGDSKFMYGYAPAFYSVIEDAFLSTNSLPELKDGLVVPLGFTKNEATHFTINAEGLDNLDPQLKVSLVDLKLNYTQVLSDNQVYEFLAEEGDDADRFELHFGVTGINDSPAAQPLNAWYANGQLHLAGVDSPATVNLTDLQGRTLWQEEHLSLNLNLNLSLNLTPGIYLVSVTEATRTRTAKIYIR